MFSLYVGILYQERVHLVHDEKHPPQATPSLVPSGAAPPDQLTLHLQCVGEDSKQSFLSSYYQYLDRGLLPVAVACFGALGLGIVCVKA
jgi:hypothetical protein